VSKRSNHSGDGDPCICEKCGESFRRIAVLPTAKEWDYCSTCMEEYLNR
jgi:RNA polymerase-binding transcription factor DksA